MCMIVFAYNYHPGYRLVLAANRDEFYDRPTEQARFWEDYPDLMAGRDTRWGGTWLAVTRKGKFAAVTNYRDMSSHLEHGLSRGLMLCDYLAGNSNPESFMAGLEYTKNRYNGYNLLLGDLENMFYSSNHGADPRPVSPGIYGLSNHLLDTPWPKLIRSRTLFGEILSGEAEPPVERLLEMLTDQQIAPDQQLPETGIGLEWERFLSYIFIVGDGYGTRSSTVLLISDDNLVTLTERSYLHPDDGGKTVKFQFTLEP